MKKVTMCLAVLALAVVMEASLGSLPAWAVERRTALVIGNADYQTAPLKNPVNDARDIAGALKNLGFSVALHMDADQRTMERAIRDFGKTLRDGGVGLFYYAGHGVQVRGRNFLVPVGAVIESEGDVKYEAVDAGLVLAKMEDAANGLNIIILDACRNNPYTRSFRSAERGLAQMEAPTGSILAYATAPGSVAADGDGQNGLYTSVLLKYIAMPGIDLPRLFMRVRKEVIHATASKQVPWESSSLIGDFYFNPQRGIAVVKKPAAAAQRPPQPKSNRPDSTAVASITPQSRRKPYASARPSKVAILPFQLDSGARILQERLVTSTIRALYSRDFDTEWSYYKVSGNRTIKMVNDEMFGPGGGLKIWKKKNLFATPKPDLKRIYEIGKKLACDLVVTGLARITTSDGQWISEGHIELFIVDIKNRKQLSKEVISTYVFIHSPEFVFNFESSVQNYLDEVFSQG